MNIIRYYKRLFSQENIDRTISGGIRPQIKLLLISIATLLFLFFVIVLVFSIELGGSDGFWERLWLVYNNFVDSGNQVVEKGWVNRLIVTFMSLCGTVLLSGVLISTISNIIERRVDAIKSGRVTYRKIKQHYVIIGFCDTTISLIKEICKKEKNTPVLLISGVQTEKIRSAIQSHLSKDDENRVVIYFGNIESEEELARLNIHMAKELYLLGDSNTVGRDSKSIESVHKISNLRGNPEGKPLLDVYVQFDRIPSYSNIQKMSLPEDYICHNKVPNIYFRPFNYYENWARQLWSLYSVDSGFVFRPLFFKPMTMRNKDGRLVMDNADKFVHLVIVGFNRMGRSLFLEALRVCHYANYDDTVDECMRTRTKLTLIDKDMDNMLPYFKSQFPYLESQIYDIDIEYINADVCSIQVRDLLISQVNDDNCMLTVAVCVSDPDMSLSLGLNLPPDIYEKDVSVLIRQDIQTDLGKLINSDCGRYKNVKIFGMLDQGMSMTLLSDELPAYVNQMYNCNVCNKTSREDGKHCALYSTKGCKYCKDSFKSNHYMYCLCECIDNDNPYAEVMKKCALNSWFTLAEVYRWSNRYQIDAYIVYCRVLGYEIFRKAPGNGWEIVDFKEFEKHINDGYLQILMKMEKYRWNAERTIAGWRNGDLRNNTYLIHNLIMPYNELISQYSEQIGKDEDVIRNIPYILKLGGYGIYRKKYC